MYRIIRHADDTGHHDLITRIFRTLRAADRYARYLNTQASCCGSAFTFRVLREHEEIENMNSRPRYKLQSND